MKNAVLVLLALLAGSLAGTAQAARSLQAGIEISTLSLPALGLLPSNVALPPLSEFLPPLDSINLPPLNDFLTSVGLPTWQEMNLPPISQFMQPVFDQQAVQLPSLAEVYSMANDTFVATVKQVVKDIPLPPGVKLPSLTLPPLPSNLNTIVIPTGLSTAINALKSGDMNGLATGLNATITALISNKDVKTLGSMLQTLLNGLATQATPAPAATTGTTTTASTSTPPASSSTAATTSTGTKTTTTASASTAAKATTATGTKITTVKITPIVIKKPTTGTKVKASSG